MSYRHTPGFMPWDRTGNRVLVQSELGRNKPTNYEIPDYRVPYGKNTFMDPEKANHLIYKWKVHQNTDNYNQGRVKDLIKTNKDALKNLCHTSSSNSGFRKTNTSYKPFKQGTKYVKIKLPEQNFTYGKPLNTEDPINLVIANDYGQTDKMYRHTMYQLKADNQQPINTKLSCHITKNHNLVKQANTKRMALFDWANRDNLKTKWKMSKFSQVPGKVDTNLRSSTFGDSAQSNKNQEKLPSLSQVAS